MLFLCLGFFDPVASSAIAKDDLQKLMARCGPHMQTLYGTGKVRTHFGLRQEVHSIENRDGLAHVRIGNFLDTTRQNGVAFIVEAESLDEAISVASLHPSVQLPDGKHLGWGLQVQPIDSVWPPSDAMQPAAEI